MGLKRILVLTFKPAVESAWREDLVSHVDFEGWQFVSNRDAHNNHVNIDGQFAAADKSAPLWCSAPSRIFWEPTTPAAKKPLPWTASFGRAS